MIIVLTENHRKDLQFLSTLPTAGLADFAKISLQFLRRGANPKTFTVAAQKLGVSPVVIQTTVEALSYVFSECAKNNLNELDFLDSLLVLAFPPEVNDTLKDLYLESKKEIRAILDELSFPFNHYENLSWRLDVQFSSRTLNKQITPTFTIKLETIEAGVPKVQYIQTDYANLRHLISELENGLNEMKSSYARRIMRNVK